MQVHLLEASQGGSVHFTPPSTEQSLMALEILSLLSCIPYSLARAPGTTTFLSHLCTFVLPDGSRAFACGVQRAAQLYQYRFGSSFVLSSSWVS